MRRLGLVLLLTACSSEPTGAGTVPPGGPVVTGPIVNESSTPVFLGSTAPPKDLALENLTLTENAELLVPEVFGETAALARIAPGGASAISGRPVIIAATTSTKMSTRQGTLVSFVGNGTEGRVLLLGGTSGIGRAAVREVDGQLTIVPLDPEMTVIPIRQNSRPACSEDETKKTLEWTDRVGPGTVATQTWNAGCVELTFSDDNRSFRACLPQDAWPFQPNRVLSFMPFARRGDLWQTSNSLGAHGVTITDGESTLELALVQAPLSWPTPIDGSAELAVAAMKRCVSVDPICAQVTTPMAVTFIEKGASRALDVGVPFERTIDGQIVTHRIVGGRVIPVHRMSCDDEISGYMMELVTLRKKAP